MNQSMKVKVNKDCKAISIQIGDHCFDDLGKYFSCPWVTYENKSNEKKLKGFFQKKCAIIKLDYIEIS